MNAVAVGQDAAEQGTHEAGNADDGFICRHIRSGTVRVDQGVIYQKKEK